MIDKVLALDFKMGILLTLTILGVSFFVPKVEVFCLNNLVYYLFYFCVGRLIKLSKKNPFETSISNFKIELMLLVILLGSWLYLVWNGFNSIKVCIAFIGIAALFIISKYSLINVLFSRFGKYSLQLYLLNGYWLVISRTIIVNVLGVTNAFMIILFNMIIDFVVSYLFIKYICERYKFIRLPMGFNA